MSESPVEVPFLLEAPAHHQPTSAPEFNPLSGTGPDLEMDCFAEQLPRSTFAPPPVDTPAADYDAVYGPLIAELDRLELLAVTSRMRLRLARITVGLSVACALFVSSASAQTVELRPKPSPTPTPTPASSPVSGFRYPLS